MMSVVFSLCFRMFLGYSAGTLQSSIGWLSGGISLGVCFLSFAETSMLPSDRFFF